MSGKLEKISSLRELHTLAKDNARYLKVMQEVASNYTGTLDSSSIHLERANRIIEAEAIGSTEEDVVRDVNDMIDLNLV